jgi:hypothetical protein
LEFSIYKIRLAITSTGKGKSGGARVITYFATEDNEVYLVNIYDKNQLENITKEQILDLLKKAGLLDKKHSFFLLLIFFFSPNQPRLN